MTARWILHADMDAFYASIEQRERPELRGKPVIVGAQSERGVVAAASYEARKFGVRSAMPGFRARQLCPHGVFLPGRMDLYAQVSQEVHTVFEEFTPQIQPLALDEAFLDITGSLHLYADAQQLGARLKERVLQSTGLVVSVGIAPNKLVAKVACTLSKPNGLNVVLPAEVRALLSPLPIARLWGVGPTTASKLEAMGITRIGEMVDCDPVVLRAVLGRRTEQFMRWARGEDDSPVLSERVPKSCGEENTFPCDVLDRTMVCAALTSHAEAVARRLRQAGLAGRTVTLKIKLGQRQGNLATRLTGEPGAPNYPLLSRSRSLPIATQDGAQIRALAVALWDEAQIRTAVRLLGVSVSNLEPAGHSVQLDLFGQRQRSDRLGSTLDAIQQRFGKSAIHRAVPEPEKLTPSLQRK